MRNAVELLRQENAALKAKVSRLEGRLGELSDGLQCKVFDKAAGVMYVDADKLEYRFVPTKRVK